MPSHTEEERRRKLPLLTRIGRAAGRFGAQTTRNAAEARAAGVGARVIESGEETAATIRRGGRQFREGRRAGLTDSPVDTSAFNPGDGTTDKTPPSEGGFNFRNLFTRGGGQRPDAVDVEPGDPRLSSGPPERPPVTRADSAPGFLSQPEAPEERAVSLNDSSANVIARRPDFNTTGKAADLPEGVFATIRGTELGFQDAGGNRFRSVPGLSVEESRAVATRRDPAFRVVTKEGIEQQLADAQTTQAQAQRTQALTNSRINVVTDGENITVMAAGTDDVLFDLQIEPVIAEAISSGQDVRIEEVSGAGITDQPSTYMFLGADGTRIDLTEEKRQEQGMFAYIQAISDGATPEEALEDAEDFAAGRLLPDVRALVERARSRSRRQEQ